MMSNIPKFKTDFNTILRLRTELQIKRDTLVTKIDGIKEQYSNLIKNNSKKIYLYCLDPLYFQYKILRVELEQFQRTIALVFNRMYGDYYKLYNIIQTQCKENNIDILLSAENVVAYKDLDPFFEYKLDDLVLIHNIIIDTLEKINVLYLSKQDTIEAHNMNIHVGFSVTSFISTLSYENKLMGEHISLYNEYLSFNHSSHRNYFEKVLLKINIFMREIEDDILTNHNTYKTETKVNVKLNDFETVIELEPEIKFEIEKHNSTLELNKPIELPKVNGKLNDFEKVIELEPEIKFEIEKHNSAPELNKPI